MIDWLVGTNGGVVPLILRLTLAAVMFPHGAQKTLGWFGGNGFRGTMAYFTKSGFPPALAFLAVMAEFLGPLGLVIGLLTRVAALGIAVVMLVAITVHKRHGFFMNWLGTQEGEGVEYHLLALGVARSSSTAPAHGRSTRSSLADLRTRRPRYRRGDDGTSVRCSSLDGARWSNRTCAAYFAKSR